MIFHDTATVENTDYDQVFMFLRLSILMSSILLFVPCWSMGYTGRVHLTDFTAHSPSGKYYAKIHYLKDDKGYERSAEVTLWKHCVAERADILEDEAKQDQESECDSEPGDRLLATATIDWVPRRARVVDRPVGVVLFETMPCPYTEGGSLAFINDRGEVTFRHVPSEVNGQFGIQEPVDFWEDWYTGYYVDEQRGLLVTKIGRTVLEISLRDGKKEAAPVETLLGGLQSSLAEEREIALRWALQSVPDGLGKAATELAEDETQPATIRIMAALAMYRSDGVEVQDLFLECLDSCGEKQARPFAALHLPEVLGCSATEHLVELLKDDQMAVSVGGACGLAFLGECAVTPLVREMLTTRTRSKQAAQLAIVALGMIGSERALGPLLEAVAEGPKAISSEALEVATGIKHGDNGSVICMFFDNWWDEAPPGFDLTAKIGALKQGVGETKFDFSARLADILWEGSPVDAEIARYFAEHPNDVAIDALKKMRSRLRAEKTDQERIIRNALKACRRMD